MGIEGPLGGGGRSGEWAMVDFNSPMRQELKRLFGVPPRPALSHKTRSRVYESGCI